MTKLVAWHSLVTVGYNDMEFSKNYAVHFFGKMTKDFYQNVSVKEEWYNIH